MIIANGVIYPLIKPAGTGLDDDGKPVKYDAQWGEEIPCCARPNTYSSQGRKDGNTFTIASYTILIDKQEFTAKRIKYNNNDYPIISVEPLEAVNMLKIMI
jgi:hypothetical protein